MDSFGWAWRRARWIAVAALITAAVLIAASQIRLIVDHGVVGWLTDDVTFGELIAVAALLSLLLALVLWPLWFLGGYVVEKVFEHRVRREHSRAHSGRVARDSEAGSGTKQH